MHEQKSAISETAESCGAPLSGIAFGLIVVGVGIAWLLHRIGIISLPSISVLWPSILIGVGFLKLFHRPIMVPRIICGVGLMTTGALLQLHKLGLLSIDIHSLWPFLVILAGVTIIWMSFHHRKSHRIVVSENQLSKFIVFGGDETRVTTKTFEGGVLTFVFAGSELDLRDADMKGPSAVLQVSAIFGGAEIRVPPHFETTIEGTPILGGFENKSRVPEHIAEKNRKKMVIKVIAVFGGVEVKN